MKTFICENCNKEHFGVYGSGRFCSKHCKQSWIAKHTKHTNKERKDCRSPYGTWKCKYCNDHPVFETRQKLSEHKHKFHPIPKGSSWNKGLTKETDIRIRNSSLKISQVLMDGFKSGRLKPQKWSKQVRKKQSEIAKKRGIGGYHRHGGRGIRGWYKGIWCDSSWELAWVIYSLEHNLTFTRCKERFEYEYKNKKHTYNPDFILENGEYIEIKGWSCNNWKAKVEQFPKEKILHILMKEQMIPILKYVKDKYGNKFTDLYESKE